MTPIKKAVVSGHSRGLGAELSAQLVRAGYLTLGISRTEGVVPGVVLDLSDPAAVIDWVETGELAAFASGTDDLVLINNAGTLDPMAPVGAQDAARLATAVNLNLTAAMLLTNAVLAARPAGCELRVMHVSSGAARRASPWWSVYCATKASLDMHAQAVSAEQHPHVRIESIAPGVVDTGMQTAIRAAADLPGRAHFLELFERGALSSPAQAAAQLLAALESPQFGTTVVTDVRAR